MSRSHPTWLSFGVCSLVLAATWLTGCPEPDVPEGDDDASQEIGGESPTPTTAPEVTPTLAPASPTPEVSTTPGPTPPGFLTPTPWTVGPTPTSPASPVLTVSPQSVDFGETSVGTSSDESVLLSNSGMEDIHFSAEIAGSVGDTFTVGPDDVLAAGTVPAGMPVGLTVTFTPPTEGAFSATLVITSDDPEAARIEVALAGTGVAPVVEDRDGDGYTLDAGDCDDDDPTVYPGAFEACDQKDNDCDTEVDEDGATPFYPDADGDGHGVDVDPVVTCDPPADHAPVADDCDDTDPTVYPGAEESCNGQDDDCDNAIDEDVLVSYYPDGDGDGVGAMTAPSLACDPPQGMVPLTGDCDDTQPLAFPGNEEVCDGIDNDCDGDIDEDLSTQTYYLDADNDGHGDPAATVEACGPVPGASDLDDDCDDQNASVYPGADESCDGVDNDCDGEVDEEGASLFYADADNDGFGDPATGEKTCTPKADQVPDGTDCDDSDAATYPGADEMCDQKDNDCDGETDEGLLVTFYADLDGDGFGTADTTAQACSAPPGYVDNASDCNDDNASIHPDAAETCDGVDNDCDGQVDEGTLSTFYADLDGDGHGAGAPVSACEAPEGHVAQDGDCNDGDPTIYPGANERCDGKDNDCDGDIDEGLLNTYYADTDRDGYGLDDDTVQACEAPAGYADQSGDCDDGSPLIHPGADETCDGLDNDCNGDIDEGVLNTYYADADGDSYGDPKDAATGCTPPTGYVSRAEDCDDTDPTVNPAAAEVCDYTDNDCDGQVDEGAAAPTGWFPDFDEDGFGNPSGIQVACEAPNGYVDNGDDCDDTDPNVNPDAEDIPANGIDEDCDGADARAEDLNGDGYPDIVVTNYKNGSDYTIDSYVYWGSATGYSDADRTGLPTEGGFMSCVADYDQDGHLDILFSNYWDGSTRYVESFIYWGSALGFSVNNRTELPSIGSMGCLSADLDSDGDIDIVLLNSDDGNTYELDSYVYWNNDGTFSRAARDEIPTLGALRVTANDLDEDGYLELIVSNYRGGTRSSPNYSVDSYIYWGSESGFSAENRTALPGIGPWKAPSVDDLDEDGFKDIIINNYYNGSTSNLNTYIYWGPDYDPSARTEIPTHGNAGSVINDFDQDGFKDIAIVNSNDGDNSVNNYVYFGSARGYSADFRQSLPTNRALDMDVADVNGDGYDDIAFAVWSDGDYSTTSYIYYGTSQGFFSSYRTGVSTLGARNVAIKDLDGDGLPEVVFGSGSDGDDSTRSYIYWNSPRGLSQSTRSTVSAWGPLAVTVADLDGNGYQDLVLAGYYSGSSYSTNSVVAWGDESGYSNDSRTLLPSLAARDVCIGDLNNDEQLDIVLANYYNGSTYDVNSYIYWGSDGDFEGPTTLLTHGAMKCALEDFDLDGDLDIAFANYRSGNNYNVSSYVYWNDEGDFSALNRTEFPTIGARSLATGDVNGDRYPDLVFGNYYNGSSYVVDSHVYYSSENGFSATDRDSLPGSGVLGTPLLADLNGDGHIDITLPGYYDGDDSVNTYIYWGSDDPYSTENRTALTVHRTWNVAADDLDGDGNMDLVVAGYYDGDDSVYSYIYWGADDGDFSSTNRTALKMNRTIDVQIADLDNDGYKDLVFATQYDGDYTTTSYIYYGSPTGFSDADRTGLRSYGPFEVSVTDLDNDGFQDIVFPNYYNGSSYAISSYIYWGNPRGFKNANRSEISNYAIRYLSVVGSVH